MNSQHGKQPAITVKHLTKSFNGIVAVSNLSLQIPSGIIFGLLGANGSGKTTTLKMLTGLLKPDQGDITSLGENLLTQTDKVQSQLGYMPQHFCLYRHLSVYENLDFIARIYGLNNRKKRLQEILALLSLENKKKQIADTLSGGWQKRLAMAAALLHNPRILLLDEPTNGLDPESRLFIWDQIQSLTEQGVTVLLSTHYMDEAERCHQLAYMAAGQLLMHGSAYELVHNMHLFSWRVHGENLSALKKYLYAKSQDIQVIKKGEELRICAQHQDIWKQFDSALLNNYSIITTATTLEDVFIYKIRHEGHSTP